MENSGVKNDFKEDVRYAFRTIYIHIENMDIKKEPDTGFARKEEPRFEYNVYILAINTLILYNYCRLRSLD